MKTPITELIEVLIQMLPEDEYIDPVGKVLVDALKRGNAIITCGNGGSATDASHLVEELTGKYKKVRRPLPGFCMNSDAAAITCIANDFGFENVFVRQLAALAKPGDVLVAFSTSGNSPNIINALADAHRYKVSTVLLTGRDGGNAAKVADHVIYVPSDNTARIQEAHTLILHNFLEQIEHESL